MIIRTLDAHTAGEPLRLIVDGFPTVEGETMLEKRAWVEEHSDHLRTALMLEPRGHADMYGALLTEPEHETSDAGVLFMHNQGYSTMCGHGIIAVTTLAIEQGLIEPRTPDELVFDTPAGQVHATAKVDRTGKRLRVTGVSFRNVPSFVLAAGIPVRLGARTVPADVAFGGAFYAIVDSEAAGIPIRPERLDELRRAGIVIKQAVEETMTVVYPEQPQLSGIYGTIFTGPAESADADLRNVTIFAEAEVDRSPCGTGTCAVMAVLAAMGLLAPEQTFTHESIIGTRFRGRIERELEVAGIPAILPRLAGEAFMTGSHTFVVQPDDPLGHGFRL